MKCRNFQVRKSKSIILRKYLYIMLLFLLPFLSAKGQDSTSNQKYNYLGLGTQYYKHGFLELHFSHYLKSNTKLSYHAFVEINHEDEWILGPKVGFDYSFYTSKFWLFIGDFAANANMIYYTDKRNSEYAFRPELGFPLFRSHIELYYGYNIILGSEKINNINSHTFTLRYFFASW